MLCKPIMSLCSYLQISTAGETFSPLLIPTLVVKTAHLFVLEHVLAKLEIPEINLFDLQSHQTLTSVLQMFLSV